MELCTTRGLSPPLSLSSHRPHFPFYPSSLPLRNTSHYPSGVVRCRKMRVVRVNAGDDETEEKRRDGVVTLEDVTLEDVTSSLDDITLNKVVFNDFKQPQQPPPGDSSSGDDDDEQQEDQQPFQQLLDNLNIKLDSEDSYKILLYGSGAFAAAWLLSAIVGSIDSIPVVPKLMEVVGLGYTVWFTTRYLLFKKNRDELASKIDELKQEVLGSGDN